MIIFPTRNNNEIMIIHFPLENIDSLLENSFSTQNLNFHHLRGNLNFLLKVNSNPRKSISNIKTEKQ